MRQAEASQEVSRRRFVSAKPPQGRRSTSSARRICTTQVLASRRSMKRVAYMRVAQFDFPRRNSPERSGSELHQSSEHDVVSPSTASSAEQRRSGRHGHTNTANRIGGYLEDALVANVVETVCGGGAGARRRRSRAYTAKVQGRSRRVSPVLDPATSRPRWKLRSRTRLSAEAGHVCCITSR